MGKNRGETPLRIGVKVVPGASRNGIVGWLGEDLKVRIQAPATDGKANDALCKFLAGEFGLPLHAVTIFSGFASRKKIVEVEGLALEVLEKVAGNRA
ncbi:MAG: DUF167 domain-containing protein [Verrucomicrobiaceae bacterium]|nr:MAG: DUF167 domain-containing protein [Verrucomicrobiaceae bacterium]